MRFRDRMEAGRQLAGRLLRLASERPVVLALPRGGVPVGYAVAQALGAPLDVLLVRKIGAPGQPELAVGAVVDGDEPQTVLNWEIVRSLAIPPTYIADESARHLEEIERRRRRYRGDRPPPDLAGHTVIVTDDGIATGATALVALQGVRAAGAARVVLAAPVAPPETVARLAAEADEVVVLAMPEDFAALSQYYDDFRQLDDAAVIELLDRAAAP